MFISVARRLVPGREPEGAAQGRFKTASTNGRTLPGAAGADPVNAKKGQLLPIVCDNLGSLTVAVNGNGDFTPGHVTTSTQVGIPYEVHTSGTFTPSDGSPAQPFSDDVVKRAPRNGRLDQCTFHVEGADEFGTFVFDGMVKISYTPLKG